MKKGTWKQGILPAIVILVGALIFVQFMAISALLSSSDNVENNPQVVRRLANTPLKTLARYRTARDIVEETFRATFSHLGECSKNMSMKDCASVVYKKRAEFDFPWWFQSLLRDASLIPHLHGYWHEQSAPNVTDGGEGIRMCAMEKIGIKQWSKVFCELQNDRRFERANCMPQEKVSDAVPKFVFLRDPLERFLSAFVDKCLRGNTFQKHSHCEPLPVFENNDLITGLLDSNKTFFEAYVSTFPLKWELHFYPQSLYCDGLFRHLPSYDFIGMMGESFYNDLNMLGMRYGERMASTLEYVFHFRQALNESKQSVGVETAASSYVLQFYTPKTLRQVLEYTAIDYYLLDIPIPEWAESMLEQDAA